MVDTLTNHFWVFILVYIRKYTYIIPVFIFSQQAFTHSVFYQSAFSILSLIMVFQRCKWCGFNPHWNHIITVVPPKRKLDFSALYLYYVNIYHLSYFACEIYLCCSFYHWYWVHMCVRVLVFLVAAKSWHSSFPVCWSLRLPLSSLSWL